MTRVIHSPLPPAEIRRNLRARTDSARSLKGNAFY